METSPLQALIRDAFDRTGLSFRGAATLDCPDFDYTRARISISKSITRGKIGPTKTKHARAVPIPVALKPQLVALTSGRTGPAFTGPKGGRMQASNYASRIFGPAAVRAGLEDVTPHDLRHTTASLAVAAGASVKAVQRMLGHTSATITLDTYAGLFEHELDAVAELIGTQIRMDHT